MIRSLLPIAFLRATTQHFAGTLRDLGHPFRTSLSSESDSSKHGLKMKLFGWPPPKLDPAKETAWLDGLRGVAAFLVMSYHYNLSWIGVDLEAPFGGIGQPDSDRKDGFWEFWRLPFLRVFMCSGHTQVSTFFVLSGFVLSWSALGSIRTGQHEKLLHSLSSAVFRRWFRLYLPCFLVGLLSLLEMWFHLWDLPVDRKSNFFAQLWDYILACKRFANPYYLERSNWDTLHSYNWTMWTIPLEYAGSIIIFLILLATGRIQDYRRRTLYYLAIAITTCVMAKWVYWLFTSGLMIADYVRQRGGFRRLSEDTGPKAHFGWVLVFLLGLLLAGNPEHSANFYTRYGYEWLDQLTPDNYHEYEEGARFWWCWAGIFIILGSCHLANLRRFFELAFIRYLGRISFMLYLTHRVIHESLGSALLWNLRVWLGNKEWRDQFQMHVYTTSTLTNIVIYVTMWLIVGSIALFVAHWCEVLADRPCTQFARWLDQKFVTGFIPEEPPGIEEEEMGLLPPGEERPD